MEIIWTAELQILNEEIRTIREKTIVVVITTYEAIPNKPGNNLGASGGFDSNQLHHALALYWSTYWAMSINKWEHAKTSIEVENV